MNVASSPYPNALNNRVNYKLNVARMHLDNLKQLEHSNGTLAASAVRMPAEINIDEFFYHLVGVKDALLQEINSELHLGLSPENVNEEAVNQVLEQKFGKDVKEDLMFSITKMKSDKTHPLGRINELHNHSKHRNMLLKHIAIAVEEGVTNFALIDPITGQPMRNQIIDYLENSYKRVEKLQYIVRKNIDTYRSVAKPT